ncbi:MAG: hypothetical protein M3N29_08970 [Chloroflexota bacterium]|nr:hypothetical protein [Chloroflexota bacterium]
MHLSVFAERQPGVALAAAAVLILNNLLGGALFFVVYGFDLELVRNPGALVDHGGASPDLLRFAALVDMLGYLALAPVVLYLHGRVGNALVTFCGLAAATIGAIGASLMASAGPWLLEASAGAPEAQAAARVAFGALENIVVVGLWGTLELFLLAIWIAGATWYVRTEDRAFAWIGAVAALGALGYAARCGLTGQTPFALETPLDFALLGTVGLFPLWRLWMAVRLWFGRRLPLFDERPV